MRWIEGDFGYRAGCNGNCMIKGLVFHGGVWSTAWRVAGGHGEAKWTLRFQHKDFSR